MEINAEVQLGEEGEWVVVTRRRRNSQDQVGLKYGSSTRAVHRVHKGRNSKGSHRKASGVKKNLSQMAKTGKKADLPANETHLENKKNPPNQVNSPSEFTWADRLRHSLTCQAVSGISSLSTTSSTKSLLSHQETSTEEYPTIDLAIPLATASLPPSADPPSTARNAVVAAVSVVSNNDSQKVRPNQLLFLKEKIEVPRVVPVKVNNATGKKLASVMRNEPDNSSRIKKLALCSSPIESKPTLGKSGILTLSPEIAQSNQTELKLCSKSGSSLEMSFPQCRAISICPTSAKTESSAIKAIFPLHQESDMVLKNHHNSSLVLDNVVDLGEEVSNRARTTTSVIKRSSDAWQKTSSNETAGLIYSGSNNVDHVKLEVGSEQSMSIASDIVDGSINIKVEQIEAETAIDTMNSHKIGVLVPTSNSCDSTRIEPDLGHSRVEAKTAGRIIHTSYRRGNEDVVFIQSGPEETVSSNYSNFCFGTVDVPVSSYSTPCSVTEATPTVNGMSSKWYPLTERRNSKALDPQAVESVMSENTDHAKTVCLQETSGADPSQRSSSVRGETNSSVADSSLSNSQQHSQVVYQGQRRSYHRNRPPHQGPSGSQNRQYFSQIYSYYGNGGPTGQRYYIDYLGHPRPNHCHNRQQYVHYTNQRYINQEFQLVPPPPPPTEQRSSNCSPLFHLNHQSYRARCPTVGPSYHQHQQVPSYQAYHQQHRVYDNYQTQLLGDRNFSFSNSAIPFYTNYINSTSGNFRVQVRTPTGNGTAINVQTESNRLHTTSAVYLPYATATAVPVGGANHPLPILLPLQSTENHHVKCFASGRHNQTVLSDCQHLALV